MCARYRSNLELCPKVGDGRSGGLGSLFDPVFEFNPLNDLGHAVSAVEFQPFFLRAVHQFEHHREAGFAAEAAFGFAGSVAHGGESAFDRVGGADVFPMLGWVVTTGPR